MDREMLYDHLRQAERHVIQGERHVARQRALLAELEEGERDMVQAKALLEQFEGLQVLHLAHRDRLKKELESL